MRLIDGPWLLKRLRDPRRFGCLVALLFAQAASAQVFPLIESFRNTNSGDWTLTGNASFTSGGSDPVGEGWLRLTSSNIQEAGSAVFNTAFSSSDGIVATFRYATYGGTGADGFSLYLIDGAT
jgi:hypothetical protein